MKIPALIAAAMLLLGWFSNHRHVMHKHKALEAKLAAASPEGMTFCKKTDSTAQMSLADALRIAEKSVCTQQAGNIGAERTCSEINGVWWFGLETKVKYTGCAPACMVNVETKMAEIRWRCVGVR